MRQGSKIYCTNCGKFLREDKEFQKYANEERMKGTRVNSEESCKQCRKCQLKEAEEKHEI